MPEMLLSQGLDADGLSAVRKHPTSPRPTLVGRLRRFPPGMRGMRAHVFQRMHLLAASMKQSIPVDFDGVLNTTRSQMARVAASGFV